MAMTDGMGTVNYEYNSLSQMTAETRQFNDSLSYTPASGNFRLEYTYTPSGGLKSLKDPYGYQVNYAFDKVGRLNSVAGSTAFAGVTTYASNPQYRAFGGLKSLTYGNGNVQTVAFNNSLKPTSFELDKSDTTVLMKKSYTYGNDGSLQYMHDYVDNKFDRLNAFDFAGRPVSAKSGAEANGGTEPNPGLYLPYRQSYQFNAFGNMTQRNNLHYNVSTDPNTGLSFNLNYTYQNNRITNTGFQYDADGRILQTALPDSSSTTAYDARGSIISQIDGANDLSVTHSYDGNGTETKRIANNSVRIGQTIYNQETKTYYIKSSVLGGETITEWSSVFVNNTTKVRYKSCVPAAGTVVAYRGHALNYTGTDNVRFEHRDASGLSYRTTTTTGSAVTSWRVEGAPAEMDPMGGNVGVNNPYPDSPPDIPEPVFHNIFSDSQMFVNGQRVTCMADGALANCHTVRNMLANGSGHIDPRTSTSELLGYGIVKLYIPDSSGDDTSPGYTVSTEDQVVYQLVGGSWNPQQQTQPQETRPPRGPSAPVDPPPPTECHQGTDDLERQTALENYNIMAPNHPLSHLRAAREGWIGETSDPQGLHDELSVHQTFKMDTPNKFDHIGQVYGNFFASLLGVVFGNLFHGNVSDNRSDTVGPGLVVYDRFGFARSQQVVIGSKQIRINPDGSVSTFALVYTDNDCDSPGQDVWSALKHAWKIIRHK